MTKEELGNMVEEAIKEWEKDNSIFPYEKVRQHIGLTLFNAGLEAAAKMADGAQMGIVDIPLDDGHWGRGIVADGIRSLKVQP